MKTRAETIRWAVECLIAGGYSSIPADLADVGKEIERLEAALAEKDAMFARLKTEPACVRVNMLRGELAMLPELEQVREYQGLVEAQQAKIAGLEAERDRLRKVADKARELEDYLSKNAGTTDDWPIDLVARDSESADKLASLLQNLCESLKVIQ